MDFDERIENHSLAAAASLPVLDREGRDVLVVVAKVSYVFDAAGHARFSPRPVRAGDVADETGALRLPADLTADEKPGTDVGVVGTAAPRAGGPAPRTLAWVQAGALRSVVQLVGARTYQSKRGTVMPGTPAPLGATPLRWDLAFGGIDRTDPDRYDEYGDNPVGRGYARDPITRLGQPAPQIEPPGDDEEERAVGFAPVPAHFGFRRARFGTLDAAWARDRAPIWPKDAQPNRYSWAAPGLWSATPLEPDLPIELGGLTASGVVRLTLPKYAVAFHSKEDGRAREHATHLDGILIDLDDSAVELTWRAAIRLPRKWQRLESIGVDGVGTISRRVLGDPPETWGDDAA